MKAKYLAVLKIHGFNRITDDAVQKLDFVELLPDVEVRLTMDPEPVCQHFDRAGALLLAILQGATGVQTTEELSRFAAQMNEHALARRKKFGQGVFLTFEGLMEVDLPSNPTQASRELEEFFVVLDTVPAPNSVVRERFRPALEGVIAAFSLNVDEGSQPQIQEVGDLVLFCTEGGKPIYRF